MSILRNQSVKFGLLLKSRLGLLTLRLCLGLTPEAKGHGLVPDPGSLSPTLGFG